MSMIAYVSSFEGRWSSRFVIVRVEGRRTQRQGKARTIRSRRAYDEHRKRAANNTAKHGSRSHRAPLFIRSDVALRLSREPALLKHLRTRKHWVYEPARCPIQAFSYERNKGPPQSESPWSRRFTSSRSSIRRPLHRDCGRDHARRPRPWLRMSVRNGAVSPRRPRPAPAS